MMVVIAFKRFGTHAEIAGGLPDIRAGLHLPCRGSMPEAVRNNGFRELGGRVAGCPP